MWYFRAKGTHPVSAGLGEWTVCFVRLQCITSWSSLASCGIPLASKGSDSMGEAEAGTPRSSSPHEGCIEGYSLFDREDQVCPCDIKPMRLKPFEVAARCP